MPCLWVTESDSATLARRVGLTTTVFLVAMIGGAGFAAASSGLVGSGLVGAGSVNVIPVGFSPAADVVAKAPLAVSVTFAEPLRARGARLRVISASGDDVGRGQVTTDHNTLRRQLRLDAPAGDYTIQWTAVSAAGHPVTGVFSFTAARGNGNPAAVGTRPTPAVQQWPPVTAGAQEGPSEQPDSTLGQPQPQPQPQPLGQAAPAPASPPAPRHQRISRGFTLVPLVVGALLVLAAGLIARFNGRSAHA